MRESTYHLGLAIYFTNVFLKQINCDKKNEINCDKKINKLKVATYSVYFYLLYLYIYDFPDLKESDGGANI